MIRPLRFLIDLLFPPKCCFCGKIVFTHRDDVCPECWETLPGLSGGERRIENAARCVSALRYEGGVRRGFLRYKFSGDYWLGEVFGEILAGVVFEALGVEFDAVTWVPLSARRLRKRGYDQAKILAETVAGLLGLPLVPALVKKRDTTANSSLKKAAERLPNVSGAYEPLSGIEGLRLLLIDDVLTTGATLSECAGALMRGGAARVVCAAFAEADGTK
ncbi:MAG: ComF family protein [Oscillospiraceae bacterium]|nr:ComF family protein [Oscillospiraceae bacterium]